MDSNTSSYIANNNIATNPFEFINKTYTAIEERNKPGLKMQTSSSQRGTLTPKASSLRGKDLSNFKDKSRVSPAPSSSISNLLIKREDSQVNQ